MESSEDGGLAERAPRAGPHFVRGVVSARSCQRGYCPVRFPMTIKTAFLEERVLLVFRGRRGCRPGDFLFCLLNDDFDAFYIRTVSSWIDGFKIACANFFTATNQPSLCTELLYAIEVIFATLPRHRFSHDRRFHGHFSV